MLRVRGCSGLRVHEVWGLRAYGGLEGVGRPKRGVYCGFKGLVVQEFLLRSTAAGWLLDRPGLGVLRRYFGAWANLQSGCGPQP